MKRFLFIYEVQQDISIITIIFSYHPPIITSLQQSKLLNEILLSN